MIWFIMSLTNTNVRVMRPSNPEGHHVDLQCHSILIQARTASSSFWTSRYLQS
jgi:hypothetical protein